MPAVDENTYTSLTQAQQLRETVCAIVFQLVRFCPKPKSKQESIGKSSEYRWFWALDDKS